jgi:hypothetical protein
MAGTPFEVIERLATPRTSALARELLLHREKFEKARAAIDDLLRSRRHNLSKEEFRAWRKVTRGGEMPSIPDPPSSLFATCRRHVASLAAATAAFDQMLPTELEGCRQALWDSARTVLPRYLVFAGGGIREVMVELSGRVANGGASLPPRKKSERAKERHLLLYLQRVCTKNDTLSEFGPGGWGTAANEGKGVTLAPVAGIARRETFLERWTAHGAAAALNGDPDVRLEIAPRLNPNGLLEQNRFVFAETGESIELTTEDLAALRQVDGLTPAFSLGRDASQLESLAERGMIRWEVEVPALDPNAFATVVADVRGWRAMPVRERWLERLEPIAALPEKFARRSETNSRIEIMNEARSRLEALGVAADGSNRFLYSASNPIGEECFRDCGFSIGADLLREVAREAAPWFDLWRDSYAFVAARVAAGLRHFLQDAPLESGAIPLPRFLRHCAERKLPLRGPGLVGLAHVAFQEVKHAFLEKFRERAGAGEIELSAEDCRFLREAFHYESFDEYTYPSADLQLAAQSVEALNRGEYQWIVAELHPPVALLHHGFYWSCPDKAALAEALTNTVGGKPNFHFGFFAADLTSTTTVHLPEATPGLFRFVTPQRSLPPWSAVPPADVDVYVDESSQDVCLRRRDSGEHLGSFARGWLIPLGFHPWAFSLGPQTPRFRCGNVVVQRRAWTITEEELGRGDFTGTSHDLILALERLRAEKGWPRHIYIRPTEQTLRRSGAEGRDKDTKPVFIDLESYPFLEIFHRWLTKAGELEVTEMLPDPDQLLWREPDGRRTFELRTLVVPGS